MFWETFIKLCDEKNKKPNAIAKELGFGTSAVTHWKNGVIPRDVSLRQIANYFGITVDYLLGKSEEKEKPATEDELPEDVIIYHRDGKTVRRSFSKDQLDMISAMLDAIPDKPKDI